MSTTERKLCRYCGHPVANDNDWNTIESGKGEELGLCWDGEICRHDAEAAIDRLNAELHEANIKLAAQEIIVQHHADSMTRLHEWWTAAEKDAADLAVAISGYIGCGLMHAEVEITLLKALAAHDARVSGNQPSIKEKLLAFLGSAASADLTALKTASVLEHDGYHITGFILLSTVGRSCIVDRSAVRWLDKDEWWWLMHVSKELQPKEDGQ